MNKKKQFLENDFFDALRWLFEGAVVWQATLEQPEHFQHQRALGMFTSLAQARALYEFFYSKQKHGDDARVSDFTASWMVPESLLFEKYMGAGKSAQKRIFHLVFNRETHSGGIGTDGTDHLKNQVIEFAKDIYRLSEKFVVHAKPEFHDAIESALERALEEAEQASKYYNIANPFSMHGT